MEITWQEGRLDKEYSKSHPDASSHPEAGLLEEGNVRILSFDGDLGMIWSST